MLGRILVAACAAALITPVAAHADTTGLVAAYGFDEGTGTVAVDSSAAGNPGTLSGPTRSTAGRYGGALSFDGSNDWVTVADSSSLDLTTAMTLEAWVKPSVTTGDWRTVVIKEQPAALAYALYSGEGNARPSVNAFTSREYDTRGASALALNTWSHLAATYDGATLRLYVNGAQVSSRALTGAMRISGGALRIGGNAVWGEYFKGVIDEVRIYNRALTAAEIGADMAAPVVAPNAPPSAPADLEATVAGDDVSLTWSAAVDDVAVTGYRVHRAATAGFTPSDANRIATVTGTSHVDAGRPAGTAYYQVVAVDSAGQAGAPSNEASATVAGDTTPPTVAIDETCPRTLSANDAIFGTAEDDSGSRPEVVLYLDGTRLKRASPGGTGDWYAEWDTYLTPNGTYSLTAVARDAAGNETTSAPCEVTIDNPPIELSFTSPADGATVSGVVRVSAQAVVGGQPLNGDIWLEIDGEKVSPVPLRTFDWDTRTLEDGSTHTLTAVAFSGYAGDPPYKTTSIHVTVDNEASAPPTVSIAAPASGATVSGTVPVTADAADDGGVTSVRFKLDGADLGAADTSAPFSVSWDTATATAGAHTLTAVARDAEGQTTTSDPVDVTVEGPPSGLSAAFGFEEGSGSAVTDSSGNGNAGTIAGATRAAAGRYGAALSFDGAGDLVTVADAAELDLSTAGSLEAWVRPAAIGGSWRTVAMKARPGGLAYALYAGADAPRPSANVWAGGSETEASGPAQLPLNAWSHVAVTYDSVALKLYVDGTAVATRALTAPIVTSTGALTIGGNTVWPEWFNGLIDEVRVYERALTAAEIQADRDRPVVP